MCAMRSLLALTLGILLPCTAMAEQFTLVCHIVPAPQMNTPEFDMTYVIDLDKGLANGKSAVVDDATITWHTKSADGEVQKFQINRVTGSLSMLDSKFGILFTGKCVKATQRQF